MNIKNPAIAPVKTKQKIPTSSFPIKSAIRANATNAMAESPPTNPSNPSVKLTAFENPTKSIRIKTPLQ